MSRYSLRKPHLNVKVQDQSCPGILSENSLDVKVQDQSYMKTKVQDLFCLEQRYSLWKLK